MITTSPCSRLRLMVSAGLSRFLRWNFLVAPKLTDPMMGSAPSSGSSSACQATLSLPVR